MKSSHSVSSLLLWTIMLFLLPGCLFLSTLQAQQLADTTYLPPIDKPAYEHNTGPVICIDEGHHNFHTMDGRYRTFARLLERDGYRIRPYGGEFRTSELNNCGILVISNALHESNVSHWYQPVYSAFSDEEIRTVRDWVSDGGSLFLIADHMPLAGAASDLAAAFGFGFTNGFVFDTLQRGPISFSRQDGRLMANEITDGRDSSERVGEIWTFTGQAFETPAGAGNILRLGEDHINLMPDTAWVFDSTTTVLPAAGLSQGAYTQFGKGRIVVFGEAAMFTAQLAGPQQAKVGMNHPLATENYRLLLNLIHWLDRRL